MPINVHHTVLFSLAYVLIVSILASTIYTLVTNMLIDAYRYEKSLERANERLRIVAVSDGSTTYYGVRNIAMMKITIREIGIVDTAGVDHPLASDITLDPGEVYLSKTNVAEPGAVYVITARGNVFTAPIINTNIDMATKRIKLRTLLPLFIHIRSPIKYIEGYKYTVGFGAYAYVFGFLFVDDPYSDNSAIIIFGPYNVAELFENKTIPLNESKSGDLGSIYAGAKFVFEIKNTPPNTAYYKITMPIEVKRLDGKKGLIIRGGVGIMWRTITNNMYSIESDTPGYMTFNLGTKDNVFRVAEEQNTVIVPASMDFRTLLTVLAETGMSSLPVSAPSGTQLYILYANCFTIEGENLTIIQTTYDNPELTLYNVTVHTYLTFPNRMVNYIDIKINVSPKALLLMLLNEI